jgi:hypothetical protein
MTKSMKMRLTGFVARMERKINAYRGFGRKLEGRRSPGRSRF